MSIRHYLPEDGQINISVSNLMGQKIRTLINGKQHFGEKIIQWNGMDDQEEIETSGVYI